MRCSILKTQGRGKGRVSQWEDRALVTGGWQLRLYDVGVLRRLGLPATCSMRFSHDKGFGSW